MVLSALWLAPSVLSSLFDGLLIGTLRWRPIAVSLMAGAFVRVARAIMGGLVGLGIDGPILATLANAGVTLGVVLWALRSARWSRERAELQLPARATTSTVAALTGYSALVAADTLMARHIFPVVAGNYAAAVTIGRIALFLPMAVTVIVFPRLVSDQGKGARAKRLLLTGLAGVLGLGFATTIVLTVARHLFVVTLFGSRYDGASALVGLLSLEGATLGAIGLLTYFHLARRSVVAAVPAVVTATAVVVSLLARPGPATLARLMVLACGIAVAVMVIPALRGHSERRPGGTWA